VTGRLHRRRVVSATGISGAGLLAASLSARAGSRQFYLLTAGLAATWTGGALAAGPLPWYGAPGRGNGPYYRAVMPVLTGAGAFGLFYGAARLIRPIPVLDRAVTSVLRYAEDGSAPLVLLTATETAVAEELFFRGALWSLAERAHPLATTTLAYTATTAVTRNPALTIAGAATSVLFGLHRRASGGILAPALAHLTWSLLMLTCLPRRSGRSRKNDLPGGNLTAEPPAGRRRPVSLPGRARGRAPSAAASSAGRARPARSTAWCRR
jgi:membrane protease YdiL (CAAX protease family)